jgi:hypothetical protein
MFEKPRSSCLVIASHQKRRFAALEQISFHGVAIEGSQSIASFLSRMIENLGCFYPIEIAQVKCILDRTIA